MAEPTVIDATDLVLGRLAGQVAPRLLDGEEIHVVNAEAAIVSGRRRQVVDRYKSKREKGTPRTGPKYPRAPDQILKRTVRGMLPDQQPRGRDALKRLKVYISTPGELSDVDPETVDAAHRPDIVSYVTLGEISEALGYEVRT